MLAPGGIRLRRGFNDPGAATMVAAPAISLFAVAESASTSIPPSDAPIASRPAGIHRLAETGSAILSISCGPTENWLKDQSCD
ncbi:hypothetical protein I547_5784 [Mycobacterium kansasii 824]|nr:hypothetical protein I547_5784 [Mycobacterium kansasii 824]